MIKEGKITGSQVCRILFEQNILKYNEKQYNQLSSGSLNPYNFIRSKIESLEITPGELGLEPCTGSIVITDPNTGRCVLWYLIRVTIIIGWPIRWILIISRS